MVCHSHNHIIISKTNCAINKTRSRSCIAKKLYYCLNVKVKVQHRKAIHINLFVPSRSFTY